MADGDQQTIGSGISARLRAVRNQIAEVAADTGRDAGDIDLLAVSKFHPAEAVQAALEAGQLMLGENRVQEAQSKYPALKAANPELRLHLIGPLQSNKVRDAVALFDVIETLDRPRLARALVKERDRGAPCPELFIQVNTGEEPQKAGIPPADADDFIREARDEMHLPVTGLMCIPPADEEPAMHFALLAECARRNGLQKLSMGMSGDFETAIRLGATEIRVGTAIFGSRPAP